MDEQLNALASLRDLHTPAEISWWPLAPGWWLLFALIIGVIGVILYRSRHKPSSAAHSVDYRQLAIRELKKIKQALAETDNEQQFITELSLLMKRCTRVYYPEAASLTGQAWLAFLDKNLEQPQFQKFHHQLCVAPYAHQPVKDKDKLIALVETWLNGLAHTDNQKSGDR